MSGSGIKFIFILKARHAPSVLLQISIKLNAHGGLSIPESTAAQVGKRTPTPPHPTPLLNIPQHKL